MDMPSSEDRYQILKEHLGSIEHEISDSDLKIIAAVASGFVSSDLA
jgi:SpoVK/Ycf46/Vps4 family AAA+-type ATPase